MNIIFVYDRYSYPVTSTTISPLFLRAQHIYTINSTWKIHVEVETNL